MGIQSLIKSGNIINKEFSYYEVPFKLDIFDEEEFQKSECEMYATVTNVETGEPEYFKIILSNHHIHPSSNEFESV